MSDTSSISQYYNLYDPTKGYTELLFRAGKVLQSKEVNELQSTLKNQIKNVGNTILTDGDVIEGCQLVIDGTSVTLTSGRIYLDGDVRDVAITPITIKGTGTEVIGAVLESEVITPDDDASLLEVASGYDNYNQDGAYRLKETVKITLDDSDATILYTLVDGQQISLNTSEDLTQLDKMQATLARRTFDESGNYKVNGLSLVDKNYSDTNNIYISLEPGKAYVKGYEVIKATAQTVTLERATDLRYVDNEPKIFTTGTDRYSLNNDYVSAISKLVASVQVTKNITRSSIAGGTDALPSSPVVRIVSVKQGDTTYSEGVDYQLTSDGIDWSLSGDEPNPGSTYTAVWQYNKTMVAGTDYTLYQSATSNTGYVEFLSGDKPVSGTTFLVNYSFTLCRRDVISIDKSGTVIVTKGQSDILQKVESPSVDSNNVLALGSVLLKPNTNSVGIINNNTKTIPMLDLYKMLERINALEYNQSISDLDNEAAAGENATELIGVLTDGFIGMSKADVYHSEWSASIDLDNQELTLPFETTLATLVVDKETDFNAGVFNRIMTAPYAETTLVSQPLATSVMRINSYNAFPKTPSVALNPAIDNWVDENVVVVEKVSTSTTSLRRWWYHKSESWAAEEKALWQSLGFADGGESLGWNNGSSAITNVTTSIVDEAIMYMRQRTVNVTISNLPSLADNIVATFDGKTIALDSTTAAYKGTTTGTLKANSKGVTSGYFTVPANTLCGTRELKVYASATPSIFGTANYTSSGRKSTVTKTVWTERVTVQATDPLAQAFQFESDQYVTGVGIYFLDKDNVEPVTVQVRNMVNGYPGTTVYAEKVVDAAAISTSTTAARETKVMFDDPVYCNAGEQYCFTILSNSDSDSVWIAETSSLDVSTNTLVSKNPYLNGTLFSSSNALTWTAHQSSDLKFNLYGAVFQTSGNAVFQVINPSKNLDRIMVTSEESIPAGCNVNWQYSINNGDWMPIETYDDRDLDETASSVKVKVSFKAATNTSPAVALDGLMLVGFTNALKSVYVSRNVYVQDGYNSVKQVIDLNLPTGTNATMYYSTDTEGDVWVATSSTSQVQKTSEYTTYTFEASLSETAHNYRCKVELTTSNQTKRPKAKNLRSIMKDV